MGDDPNIRVEIIDRSAFGRAALPRLVEADPRLKVIGLARDDDEGLSQTLEHDPDIVLLSLTPDSVAPLRLLNQLMARAPRPVILLTQPELPPSDQLTALEAGALTGIPFSVTASSPVQLLAFQSLLASRIKLVHAARGEFPAISPSLDPFGQRPASPGSGPQGAPGSGPQGAPGSGSQPASLTASEPNASHADVGLPASTFLPSTDAQVAAGVRRGRLAGRAHSADPGANGAWAGGDARPYRRTDGTRDPGANGAWAGGDARPYRRTDGTRVDVGLPHSSPGGSSLRQKGNGADAAFASDAHASRQGRSTLLGSTPECQTEVVVFGAGLGGVSVLCKLIEHISHDTTLTFLAVLQLPDGLHEVLAERLNRDSAIRVKMAREGEPLKAGLLQLAPPGKNLSMVRTGRVPRALVHLTPPQPGVGIVPNIDVTMRACASVYGAGTFGIILNGISTDGLGGLQAIKARGGMSAVLNFNEAIVASTNRHCIEAGLADDVLSAKELSIHLSRLGCPPAG